MYNSVSPWTVARQAPLSMGILQARILEWVAMSSSRVPYMAPYNTCCTLLHHNLLSVDRLSYTHFPVCRQVDPNFGSVTDILLLLISILTFLWLKNTFHVILMLWNWLLVLWLSVWYILFIVPYALGKMMQSTTVECSFLQVSVKLLGIVTQMFYILTNILSVCSIDYWGGMLKSPTLILGLSFPYNSVNCLLNKIWSYIIRCIHI